MPAPLVFVENSVGSKPQRARKPFCGSPAAQMLTPQDAGFPFFLAEGPFDHPLDDHAIEKMNENQSSLFHLRARPTLRKAEVLTPKVRVALVSPWEDVLNSTYMDSQLRPF